MSSKTSALPTTTHVCFPPRPAFLVLAVGFLASGARATVPEFSWVPVDASAPFTTAQPDSAGEDTEMITAATITAFIVEFEIRINGWADVPGAPTVGTALASVDATGFLGANATPANPGADLSWLNNQPWRENPGGHGPWDGVFMVTDTCHETAPPDFSDTGHPCGSVPPFIMWDACPAGTSCSDRDDFIFAGNLAAAVVATSSPNVQWGGFSNLGQCTEDMGLSYYLGTLVLNVPGGATGTYTIGFDPAPWATTLNDCSGTAIPDLTLTPGHLTLQTGSCCTLVGPGEATCEDNALEEDCTAPNQTFVLGGSCAGPCPCPECGVDQDCTDANACTDDFCSGLVCCDSVSNFDEVVFCCNPSTGELIVIDDDDVCTLDVCDVVTGEVTHPILPVCETGACCNPDGSCADNNSRDSCNARHGTFQGDTTRCAEIICLEVLGACCDTDGGCVESLLFDCALLGNSGWAGPNTTCGDSFDPTEIMGVTCGDGLDNDCDGLSDCEDPDCGADCAMPSATPLGAPFPHDRRKNRYISFDPNKGQNDGTNIAFKITLKEITMGSCNDDIGAQGGRTDFCRIDRGDADCKACSGSGAACITTPIDCSPGESCDPTGAVCVNDAPVVGGSNVGKVWWVGPGNPASSSVHLMVSEPFRKVSTDWPNPTHVGDCEVVPRAVYGVRAVAADTSAQSDELVVETSRFPPVAPPAPFWWGDAVGVLAFHCNGDIREQTCDPNTSNGDCTGAGIPASCCTGSSAGLCDCPGGDPCTRTWALPNGATNIDDVTAALWTSAPAPPTTVSADFTWVDVHGNGSFLPGSQNYDPPNYVINASDLQQIISAFEGRPYTFHDPADCPDEPDWP